RRLLARLADIRSAMADDPERSLTDAAYGDAFRGAAIDPDILEAAEAGARIPRRPPAVARALVAALDNWTLVRKARREQGRTWPRLLAAARVADPDPNRDEVRAAMLVEDKAQRVEKLRPVVSRADAESWSPDSMVLLSSALAESGDLNAAVDVLRRAAGAHPGDALVHYNLGVRLDSMRPPQADEASRAYSIARALQPELAGHELAHALEARGRRDEADLVWRDLVRRRPDNCRHLNCYGFHLQQRGQAAQAKSVFEHSV